MPQIVGEPALWIEVLSECTESSRQPEDSLKRSRHTGNAICLHQSAPTIYLASAADNSENGTKGRQLLELLRKEFQPLGSRTERMEKLANSTELIWGEVLVYTTERWRNWNEQVSGYIYIHHVHVCTSGGRSLRTHVCTHTKRTNIMVLWCSRIILEREDRWCHHELTERTHCRNLRTK